MKRETLIWTIVLLLGAVILLVNAGVRGAGNAYVHAVPLEFADVGTDEAPVWINVDSDAALDHDVAAVPEEKRIRWTRYEQALPRDYRKAEMEDPEQTVYQWSLGRTLGIWVAALFTLFIASFLYRDNPFYKVAESVVVGVSAGYWMVVGFWQVLIPNLFGKIHPGLVTSWAMPGLNEEFSWKQFTGYTLVLVMGIMLLWRLAPKGGWISRWPLSFIIGTTAGIRLVGFIHADFLSQIRNTIIPLVVADAAGTGFDFWASVKNLILVVGVLTSLVYFFFSIEHKGLVGKTAKVGIWFLMVTFGAAFGYTVMGRIALLAIRLEFLFDDWLWLVDPTNKRAIETVAELWQPTASALGLG